MLLELGEPRVDAVKGGAAVGEGEDDESGRGAAVLGEGKREGAGKVELV